ncbi:alpha/beta hydrolase [Peterkaempfera griseoplana]|uniref:alpha/beta hydrolase n=1 Tax=Peterkaempfera griseoplana TaxID=66896 RepID=UPI0006E1AFA3|nr:alpha/beta hydrolase [Peterkaempfera griseoplana]
MTDRHPQRTTVAVPGGDLAVLRWPADDPAAPTVLALHGITANGLAWGEVAEQLAGRVALVAPDLRGRAGSRAVAGPYGLARHADDAAAVLDHLGLDDAVVAGHSMGAWVAALTAVRHPGRVRRAVLVDGAVSFPLPDGVTEDDALAAVLGPALARLGQAFPSRDAYRDFWREHPAFGDDLWTARLDAHLLYDLVGDEPELRSSCVAEAVHTDGSQVLLDPEAAEAIRKLPCPATLLWAERGLLDQPQGMYDADRLTAAALDPVTVTTVAAPGTNHYTVLLGERGARAVADLILAEPRAEGRP